MELLLIALVVVALPAVNAQVGLLGQGVGVAGVAGVGGVVGPLAGLIGQLLPGIGGPGVGLGPGLRQPRLVGGIPPALIGRPVLSRLFCLTQRCPILPNCPALQQFTPPGSCCPICRLGPNFPGPNINTCVFNGLTYQNGQSFQQGCNTCTCRNGFVQCQNNLCPPQTQTCFFNGLTYQNGQSFQQGCNTCTCRNGFVQCTNNICPPPFPGPGTGTCFANGQVYQQGQTFFQNCNTCTCFNGQLSCTFTGCQSDTCSWRGEIFVDGETFTKECNTCRCDRGRDICTTNACPVTNCDFVDCPPLTCLPQFQVIRPGNCCNVCSTGGIGPGGIFPGGILPPIGG